MKKTVLSRILTFLLVLCVLCGAFCSCGNKLKMKKGKFVSSRTGVEYSIVRSVYLPKAVSEEVYATFEQDDVKVDYFEAEGLDPEEWLVSELGDFLYAGDTSALPDLSGFGAKEMLICYNGDVLFSIIDETDAQKVADIVRRVGEVTPIEKNYDDFNAYRVVFASDTYPAIYYQMKLAVTEENIYLVDSSIGANYEVTDLFSGYADLAYVDEDGD